MTKKHKGILFLDMDGVLCTPRMWLANGRKGHNQLDPVCVKLLDLFCNKYELSLVCSSAWRMDNIVPRILATHGFTAHFVSPYDDIREGKEPDYSRVNTPCHNMQEDSTRGGEILAWLTKWGHLMEDQNRFIIFDDEIKSIECKTELRGHIVECDMYNGISFNAYLKAEEIMERLQGKS